MIKKVLPVIISIFVIYLIWCFIKPSISYHSIKRRVNDLHSQDAFTTDRISSDQFIYDSLYSLADSKGIFPEEMEVVVDRYASHRIRSITVHYTDYVLIFRYEIIPRNYSYTSKTEDRRRSL